MLNIVVAIMLLALIAAEVLHAVQARKKLRRHTGTLFLARFRELAALYRLRFSSQEIFGLAAMGFDGVQRKLLILVGHSEPDASYHLIDLAEIKACRVLKQYRRMIGSGARPQRPEQYLHTISLCFDLRGVAEPIEVVFYRHTGGRMQTFELEKKAKRWEAILSKMHNGPAQARSAGRDRGRKI